MRAAIERIFIAILVLVIGCVIAIDIASLRQAQRLQDSTGAVRHSNQVISRAQDVLLANIDYETTIKDLLLNADSGAHATLWRADTRLRLAITDLRLLLLMDLTQTARVDSLQLMSDRDKVLLDSIVRVKQVQGMDAAMTALNGDQKRRAVSVRIHGLVEEIVSKETQELNERRAVTQRVAGRLQEALTALLVVVAIFLIVLVQRFRLSLSKEKIAMGKLSVFNQDLKEQVRQGAEDLLASEEKYKTIFYKSPLPKWIYDADTLEFIEVNEAAISHYGFSREEFLEKRLGDLLLEEDQDRLRDTMSEIHKGYSREPRQSEWKQKKKNGEVMIGEFTTHPLKYDQHNARMVVVNDITVRRKNELLLQQLNEDLQKRATDLMASNAELERFAYIASHDLQEPLRMVSSFLQLLRKKYQGKLDTKADQYIHFAVDGAERMKTLIMDLLEYSRVGTAKENFVMVNMQDVMDEVATTFREKIMAAGAIVATSRQLPIIRAEKGQMTQLLQNLVGNALKYRSEAPPVIRVGASEMADAWQFSVQDNGIGIDPQFWDKIFIIFQRLHNKSEFSGTGIGLAICKKIVERHGGQIRVESGTGVGSTFIFTISKHL